MHHTVLELGERADEVGRLCDMLARSDSYAFCVELSDDDPCYVSYNRKHFRINLFFRAWDVYKALGEAERECMREHVLPQFADRLNWTTVSRLYDPSDALFVDLFGTLINREFALQYNPRLPRPTDRG